MKAARTRTVGRFTIRGKILAAFGMITAIVAMMGGYAVHGVHEAGSLVVETFDRPLMTISHARSALANFAAMRELVVRQRLEVEPGTRGKLDQRLSDLAQDFTADLSIAEVRGASQQAPAVIERIRQTFRQWNEIVSHRDEGREWVAMDRIAEQIAGDLDLLVELTAGESFLHRQRALATIEATRWLQIAGGGGALLLTALLTFILARRIIHPIQTASNAARRIADGDLAFDVPQTSRDETGALLAAMAKMQASLREMMAREVARRQSAQMRLVGAIEGSPEAVILVDDDDRILIVNSQAKTFFAPVAHALVPGSLFGSFERMTEERGLLSYAEGGSEGRLADGRWLRVSRTPTRDGGTVVIWSDISELKEREAALRLAKDGAEAANRAKTNFLTNMSHELRTPLNAVIGFSEIMAGEMFGPIGTPQYQEFSTHILSSGRHLLDVINDILDISKSEAGKLTVTPQPIQIAHTLNECRTIIADQCAKAGLKLEVVPPPEGMEVVADPVKLRQILLNLLSNAVKFTNPGGVVTLLAGQAQDGAVQFIVSDTGIGMRTEDIAVALTPFGQIDTRLARKYEGTGLGLSLTKVLVELHGGVMHIESELDVGTVVTVNLPAGDALAEAA